jgi:hypothetical protein
MRSQATFDKPAFAPRDHLRPERGVVIPFKPVEQDNSRDPRCPVPARIAKLRQAVLDGRIKADYVKIVVTILQLLKPDRIGNWRTITPLTHALIAEMCGCKPRTVRTALGCLRQHFDWFGWRLVPNGFVFKMRLDGTMVARVDARASSPKELTKELADEVSKETEVEVEKEKRPVAVSKMEPAPIRLARWRATLPAEVVTFGISLGLTRREVLAVAERFEQWYAKHPEREPANLTGAFCGRIWLERDAARKAAKVAHSAPQSGAKSATGSAKTKAHRDIHDKHDHAWPPTPDGSRRSMMRLATYNFEG